MRGRIFSSYFRNRIRFWGHYFFPGLEPGKEILYVREKGSFSTFRERVQEDLSVSPGLHPAVEDGYQAIVPLGAYQTTEALSKHNGSLGNLIVNEGVLAPGSEGLYAGLGEGVIGDLERELGDDDAF